MHYLKSFLSIFIPLYYNGIPRLLNDPFAAQLLLSYLHMHRAKFHLLDTLASLKGAPAELPAWVRETDVSACDSALTECFENGLRGKRPSQSSFAEALESLRVCHEAGKQLEIVKPAADVNPDFDSIRKQYVEALTQKSPSAVSLPVAVAFLASRLAILPALLLFKYLQNVYAHFAISVLCALMSFFALQQTALWAVLPFIVLAQLVQSIARAMYFSLFSISTNYHMHDAMTLVMPPGADSSSIFLFLLLLLSFQATEARLVLYAALTFASLFATSSVLISSLYSINQRRLKRLPIMLHEGSDELARLVRGDSSTVHGSGEQPQRSQQVAELLDPAPLNSFANLPPTLKLLYTEIFVFSSFFVSRDQLDMPDNEDAAQGIEDAVQSITFYIMLAQHVSVNLLCYLVLNYAACLLRANQISWLSLAPFMLTQILAHRAFEFAYQAIFRRHGLDFVPTASALAIITSFATQGTLVLVSVVSYSTNLALLRYANLSVFASLVLCCLLHSSHAYLEECDIVTFISLKQKHSVHAYLQTASTPFLALGLIVEQLLPSYLALVYMTMGVALTYALCSAVLCALQRKANSRQAAATYALSFARLEAGTSSDAVNP